MAKLPTRLLAISAIALAIQATSPARANHGKSIDEIIQTSPTEIRSVGKNIYEVERCIIGKSSNIAPIIYQQPDTLNNVTMLYQSLNVSILVLSLHGQNDSTSVSVYRHELIGSPHLTDFEACL